VKLKIMIPSEIFLEEEVTKVVAEAENGFFCFLPRHVDYTAALVPGVLSYTTADGRDHYLAVDVGTIVKKGDQVLVSTRNAVAGGALGELKDVVVARFREIDEREKKARAAAAKIELDVLRRFMELRHE